MDFSNYKFREYWSLANYEDKSSLEPTPPSAAYSAWLELTFSLAFSKWISVVENPNQNACEWLLDKEYSLTTAVGPQSKLLRLTLELHVFEQAMPEI